MNTECVAWKAPDSGEGRPSADAWTLVDSITLPDTTGQALLAGLAACGADPSDAQQPFTPLRARVQGLAILTAEMFKRGHANASDAIDIADAVFLLGHLFASGSAPSCKDAGDANDDGAINIADAIKILAHLFASAGPLPAPFGACGIDTTDDELGCESYGPCQ